MNSSYATKTIPTKQVQFPPPLGPWQSWLSSLLPWAWQFQVPCISGVIQYSVTGLLHWAWCPPSSSVLSPMTGFPSFLGLNKIPWCVYTAFLLPIYLDTTFLNLHVSLTVFDISRWVNIVAKTYQVMTLFNSACCHCSRKTTRTSRKWKPLLCVLISDSCWFSLCLDLTHFGETQITLWFLGLN